MSSETAGRAAILAAALLFSTGGAAIKAAALSGWQVACFRSAVAALFILLLPGARRNWSARTLLVGLAYGATLILFVLANKLTTSANAIFLQGSAPLYLLLLGPWLLRERIRRSDLALVAVLTAGMALFFLGRQVPLRTAPDPVSGNIIGAFAGLAWALTIAGLRWVSGRDTASGSGLAPVAAGNLLAFSIALPFALPAEGARAMDWALIVYMGAFQVGLAYVCLTRGLRALPALEASLLLLAEPALNPVWSWMVHGERPGALALAGGSLILAGTAGSMLRRARRPRGGTGARTTSGARAS
ncbi:MAG: EamA family transporter [Bryobacteraceae bacterium]|nr:EamA family transporter [Bryobacteraceae bacterium]